MRTALVVPTIRPASMHRFLEEWEGAAWDDVIVVYDGPRSECRIEAPGALICCWEDYAGCYGARGEIFSRRDSACRSFGFLRAVARGADAVITLDDDCYPTERWAPREFVGAHLDRLEAAPRWASSVPGLAVRGLPRFGAELLAEGPPVTVNMGLWSGVPDLSAADTLAALEGDSDEAPPVSGFVPAAGSRVMSPHQMFPFSGMNFAFRSRALPALYFPRMGRGSPYSRFDDIWCGLLLQRILAATGELITVGEPWVRHDRASDVSENQAREAPGTAVNEGYWRLVSELPLQGGSVTECVVSAAQSLAGCDDAYLASWGRALAIWVSLSDEALAGLDRSRASGLEHAVARGTGRGE